MTAQIEIISDRTQMALDDVMQVFAHGAWTQGRSPEQVAVMLEHTSLLVLAKERGRPVGFARAITDHMFRAFLEDVIVVSDKRDQGVGRLLVEEVERVLRQWGVLRIELTTERVSFWERLGYEMKANSTYMFKKLTEG